MACVEVNACHNMYQEAITRRIELIKEIDALSITYIDKSNELERLRHRLYLLDLMHLTTANDGNSRMIQKQIDYLQLEMIGMKDLLTKKKNELAMLDLMR